jgi:hypothetical protein
MRNIEDNLINRILEKEHLTQNILNRFKLNKSNIILYPLFKKDKIALKEILMIGADGGKLTISINNKIIDNLEFRELTLFMKEVEEFLLLEDRKSIDKKLEDFNHKYMTVATPILDMIFEVDGDLKILEAKIDFDSFMSYYRYKAMEYGLYYLSETILATIPKDTKKIYFATTSGLNKMSSYEI